MAGVAMLTFLRSLIALNLLATIASTLSVYPHQLAYFNEGSGGPEMGHRHLLHSNLDWGQDLLIARRWAETRCPPCQIRFVSHLTYPGASLFAAGTDAEPAKASICEVVSATDVLRKPSYHGRIGSCRHVRIAYAMWAFPADDEERE